MRRWWVLLLASLLGLVTFKFIHLQLFGRARDELDLTKFKKRARRRRTVWNNASVAKRDENIDNKYSSDRGGMPFANTIEWLMDSLSTYTLIKPLKTYDPAKEYVPPIVPELLYWYQTQPLQTRSDFPTFAPLENDKYLTFESDLGGFNNIRLGFQYFARTAALSGRVLVLPVDCGWYLLDWSAMFTFPRNSDYGMFFDLEDMARVVPVITSDEFLARERKRLGIPDSVTGSNPKAANCVRMYSAPPSDRTSLSAWLREHSAQDRAPDRTFPAYKDTPILHCKQDDSQGWRFLFGWSAPRDSIPSAVAEEPLYRFQRNHVHLRPEIAFVASRIIRALGGPFAYSAVHVRRGDFQYPTSKISDDRTYTHIRKLFNPNETIYLSTDESPEFFKSMAQEHPVHVRSFFDKDLKDISIDPKLAGMVEQMVCSLGRIFIGTPLSTFTGGIYQMRFFNDLVLDQRELWHTQPY